MKRFLQGVLAIILAMTVAVFGLTSILGTGVAFASTETYVFRLAVEMPIGHPYWAGASKFNELLQERTEGRVKVEIYPSGQLGTQKETAEAVACLLYTSRCV